jgi:hypothetical protein
VVSETFVLTDEEAAIRLNQDASVLECVSATGALAWAAPTGDIVLIAEYTTSEGPGADYYLIFVTVEAGTLYFSTTSFYSDGRDEVLNRLSELWKAPLQLGLCNSTEWKSRVIWPLELAGHDYFEFRELEPTTLFEKLSKVAFGPAHEYSPCVAVRDFLRGVTAARRSEEPGLGDAGVFD